jgi:hypothetical protein
MVTFLDDRLPGDVWQARRNAQKLGSKADPYAELRAPHDSMSGPEWQAAREAQVNGAPVRLKELGLAEEIRDARPLMDRIGGAEGGRDGYDATYGFGRYWPKGAPKPTQMTIDQVEAQQGRMLAMQRSSGNPSSSVGRYQINKATLDQFGRQLGLRGDELYSPDVQDKLMMLIANSNGLQKYRRGEMQAGELRRSFARRFATIADVDGHPRKEPSRTAPISEAEFNALLPSGLNARPR